jgi:hypothetical protein
MKLTTAILTNAPRTVQTKYGSKTVIDAVRTDNNEPITLWRPANDSYCQKLGKNSRVSVGIDHKNKPNLIEDEAITNLGQPLPALPEIPVPVRPLHNTNHVITQDSEKPSQSDQSLLSPDKKREIAQYVSEMGKLYGFCLQQAENLNLEGEDRRCVATSLFIQATKHFNL